MKKMLALFATLFLANSLYADIEITGPDGGDPVTEAQSGDIIILMLKSDTATAYKWLSFPTKNSNGSPVLVQWPTDPKIVIVSSKAGKYVIHGICANAEKIETKEITVVVGGQPGPTPNPVDPINPDTPTKPEGFAGQVYDHVVEINRPAEAANLAKCYLTVADEIKDKKLTKTQDVINRITELYGEVEFNKEAWKPYGRWEIEELQKVPDEMNAMRTAFLAFYEGFKAASEK